MPSRTKGISLFIVPKFIVNDDGSIGQENDIKCLSIEHKLGIHASPTCVLQFGDNGGATGYIVGEENRNAVYVHHDESGKVSSWVRRTCCGRSCLSTSP